MTEQTIGRYAITGLLGQGGMAAVYRAYDPRFDRDVAIKMLYQLTSEDDGLSTAKFEQEARIIAGLEHYAIVPVYDYGEHDGRPYLVMRLMDGGSLKEKLAFGQLSLQQISEIMERICAALDKAHSHRIVHRDIKPGNILFDEDDIPFLADFGIARLTDRTQTTTLIGSPRYMAPEQAQGRPLSPQTDIYQMGVVLYHMLAGRVPFDAETTDAILYQHVYQPPPPLRTYNPDLPAACETIIQKALKKAPEERHLSAGELARTFQIAVGQQPALPRPARPGAPVIPTAPTAEATDTIAPRPVKPAAPAPRPAASSRTMSRPQPLRPPPPELEETSRRPWGWILFLSVIGILLFACSAAILVASNPDWIFPATEPLAEIIVPTPPEEIVHGEEPEASPAPEDTPDLLAPTATLNSQTNEAIETIFLLSTEELADLGGGSGLLVYAAERGENNNFDIYISRPNGREFPVADDPVDEFRPVWSPDGRKIVYHALRGTWEIYVVNADGTGRVNLSRSPADDSFPQWSPDGSRIAFHSNRIDTQFDIFVMDADGNNVERLTSSPEAELGPTWSPDGRQIAFYMQVPDGGRQIFIMNADGSNIRQLTSGKADALFPAWSPDGQRIAFHSNRDGVWQIFTAAPDGGNLVRVTNIPSGSFYPVWSPNGEWLLFHAIEDDSNRDLFMVRPDGTDLTRLTETPGEERMPGWQP